MSRLSANAPRAAGAVAHARARRPKRVQGAPAPPPGVRRGLGVLGVPSGGGGTAAGPRGSAGMGRLMSHWQDATSAVLFWLDWVSPVPDGASLLLVWSWMLVLCAIRSVLEGEKNLPSCPNPLPRLSKALAKGTRCRLVFSF